jgi:hypothetical protein
VHLKQIVGYALTALAVLWGLVYYPLQCIAIVRPYANGNPLAALDYYPLIPVVLVPILALIVYWLEKISTDPNKFTSKGRFLLVLWFTALLLPAETVTQLNRFLTKKDIWAGSCVITNVRFGEDAGIDLLCGNGKKTWSDDTKIVQRLLQGKTVNCALNARGSATCQP